jgi:alpha-mannosidase
MVDKNKPKDYTVHMIGNAHLDPVWLWRLDEGRKEASDTSRSALDRLNETPEFIFCRSSAVTYQWVEEDDPAMFAEIDARVRDGRWDIVNGWWVQPDCNIPGGESYARQALYAKEYFTEKFGDTQDITVGYNVDTFGHNGNLPQILAKSGFKYYCFFRPDPVGEKPGLPQVFWWEAPDGSRILASRPPHHYGCGGDAEQMLERINGSWEETVDDTTEVMCFYGVGNHGGGPTKINIESILDNNTRADTPNAKFSTPDTFFEAILAQKSDFPVIKDDLQIHAVGCYSVVAKVKAFNRRCEQELMKTERYATLANTLFGAAYPFIEVRDAWRDVLFNQFHDVLAGTSLSPAYEDVYNMYGKALEATETASKQSLRTLARNVDTRGDGLAVTVFNPSAWQRTDFVTAEIEVASDADQLRMFDSVGNEVIAQIVEHNAGGDGGTVTIGFVADVPATGYMVYRVILDAMPMIAKSETLRFGATMLGNEFFTLNVDPVSGAISSLKTDGGPELIGGEGVTIKVLNDTSDTWSHGITRYDDDLGDFTAGGNVRVVESGPVRATIEIEGTFNQSKAVQRISVYPGVNRVDVTVDLDFNERHRILKLAVPTAVTEPDATFEIPYAFMTRDTDGAEMPGQKWIDVTGTADGANTAGVALINDDKYGFDVRDSEMRMSILRTCIYAFHDPREVQPKERYHYVDLGESSFNYALVPHAGDWRTVRTPRAGEEFNTKMTAFVEPYHNGSLSKDGSALLEVEPENVVGTVLKKSQDDSRIIVRVYESFGQDGKATIRLPKHGIEATVPIGHHELKTLAFDPANPTAAPVEVDLLEKDM